MSNAWKNNSFLLIAIMIVTLLFMPSGTVWAAEEQAADVMEFTILTVNDFHGALVEAGKNPGAAKLAAYIESARLENPTSTLVVSAGDMFQGTADSNLLYGKTVVEIMNAIGFDAMTLGNHEFDWGVPKLTERINQSEFPYIAANVIDKATNQPATFVKPYVIVERQGVKIAIIGLATPETAVKSNPKVVSAYRFADPVQIVTALVSEIKKQGVDIIVIVSHLGCMVDPATQEIVGEAADFAKGIAGVDALVTGHSHQRIAGKVNLIPLVQASFSGRAVGKIKLSYSKIDRKVINSVVEVVDLPVAGLAAEPTVTEIVRKAGVEIAPIKNVVLGQTVNTLSHDKMELSLLGQWTADVMRQAGQADIAFQNGGGLRTSIAAGNITMGNLYEVIPFDNTLCKVDMTGAQICKVLEHGIRNANIGMVQFSGIKVIYDASLPSGQRVTRVILTDGTPLVQDKIYKVVTNDFMFMGGDGYSMFKEASNGVDTYLPIRDCLIDAIKKAKVIDVIGDDRLSESKENIEYTLPRAA